MNRTFSLLIALLVLTAASAADVRPACADDGWSWSKLNPFAKKESKAEAKHVRASYDERVADARTRSNLIRKGEEPSTWDKMNQGTKSFFGKTKSVLMPWTNTKKSSSRAKGKSSIFTSWLPTKKEEPRRPKTVRDFLDQPMPY